MNQSRCHSIRTHRNTLSPLEKRNAEIRAKNGPPKQHLIQITEYFLLIIVAMASKKNTRSYTTQNPQHYETTKICLLAQEPQRWPHYFLWSPAAVKVICLLDYHYSDGSLTIKIATKTTMIRDLPPFLCHFSHFHSHPRCCQPLDS